MLPVLTAAAQEASPSRRCADAATGTEVEVCLRLAAENPDAVDEITAALVAWVDRVEGPDRALLEALVLLQSGSAVEGCARLAATGDPRAELVLVDTVRTRRQDAVRVAAIQALAAFPGALPELAGWIEARDLPNAVRVAAVEALSRVDDPHAREVLVELARRPGLAPPIQAAVVRVVARSWPGSVPGDLPPSENGALWLATGTTLSLGYALGAAGWFGRSARWEVGAVTGATAGATAGWIYGHAWPMEAGDAGLVATSGALGTASGVLLGAGLAPDTPSVAVLGGLAGEGVGLATSAVLAPLHPGTGADAAESAALAALAGGAAALGARARGDEPSGVALAAGVGLLGGAVVGPIASPGFELRRDVGVVAVGALLGAAGGALTPGADPALGPASGAVAGAVAGGLVGGWADVPPDLLVGAISGAGLGGGLGAGAGLAGGAAPAVRAGLGIGGGALGALTGTAYALVDPDPIDDRDAVLTGAAIVWAGWNAAALADVGRLTPDRALGAVLVASSAAGALTTTLDAPLDVPVPATLCATSLGIWGGYVGWQAGDLAGLRPLSVAVPASDVGLALGAVLVSPSVGVPPLVLGVADAGGVFGGATGALVAGLATADADLVTGSSLVGAGVGGAVGLAVGAAWHRSQGRRDVVFAPGDLPPVALGPGPVPLGATLSVGPW